MTQFRRAVVSGVRRRTAPVLVAAALSAALVVAAMAPALATADPIASVTGGVSVTIDGGKLAFTNTSQIWSLRRFKAVFNSSVRISDVKASPTNSATLGCTFGFGAHDAQGRSLVVCETIGGALMPRDPPARIDITYEPAGYTGGLLSFAAYFSNEDTGNCTTPFTLPVRFVPMASIAALDKCGREKLGTPKLTAKRSAATQLSLTISGAPAGWSVRVFGASTSKGVKTATSGTTITTLAARTDGYPRGTGTFQVKASTKFVRAAWTKAGEKPILGPIATIRK